MISMYIIFMISFGFTERVEKKTSVNYWCKRLAGPIIPLSNLGTPLVWSDLAWSCMVWSCWEKEFCLWLWSHGCTQQPYSWRQGNFGMVTNKGTTRWTLSRPAFDPWEGSLLEKAIICNSCAYCTRTHYEYINRSIRKYQKQPKKDVLLFISNFSSLA